MNISRFQICLIYVFVTLSGRVIATPDSTRIPIERTEFIADLNVDGVRDTVYSLQDTAVYTRNSFIPKRIKWGVTTDTSITPPRYSQTYLQYGSFQSLSVALVLDKIDTDTLKDLAFYMTGKIQVGTVLKDTARIIALLGQRKLDTFQLLTITQCDTIQQQPYKAIELKKNQYFKQAAVRDGSGMESYIIEQVTLVIDPPSALISDIISEERNLATLSLQPNPASSEMIVSCSNLLNGSNYSLVLTSIEGKTIFKYSVTPKNYEIRMPIDVSMLTSGRYIFSIFNDTKELQSASFLVIH